MTYISKSTNKYSLKFTYWADLQTTIHSHNFFLFCFNVFFSDMILKPKNKKIYIKRKENIEHRGNIESVHDFGLSQRGGVPGEKLGTGRTCDIHTEQKTILLPSNILNFISLLT